MTKETLTDNDDKKSYGPENDDIDALGGDDRIFGRGGHDKIDAGAGNDSIYGNEGRDTLWARGGTDLLNGGAGNDHLHSGPGADTLAGGSGFDTAHYSNSNAGVIVDLGDDFVGGGYASAGDGTPDTLLDIEALEGSAYADRLEGDDDQNRLLGGDGDDILFGGDSFDRLRGGAGADQIDGGSGIDSMSYRGSDSGVAINLATDRATGGHATGDTLTSIEIVSGSIHDDDLLGTDGDEEFYGASGDDALLGGGGDDALVGARGDDRLNGGAGDDRLEPGAGADRIVGGPGADQLDYAGSSAGVSVNLANGKTAFGDAEADIIDRDAAGNQVATPEHLSGSDHADTLIGDGRANSLSGRAGNDFLAGSAGDDIIDGGPGADSIIAGDGTDTLLHEFADGPVVVDLTSGGTGGEADGDSYTTGFSGTTVKPPENVEGWGDADTLRGDSHANVLRGLGSADTLAGRGGDDTLNGGVGADSLIGGDGQDTASYAGASEAVTVKLWTGAGSAGEADGDSLSGIEDLIGGGLADTLVGGAGANVLEGGPGGDRLTGGPGRDTASYAGADAAVTAKLWTGGGQAGAADGDTFRAIENLRGSAFDDTLVGDGGDNVIQGGPGADAISGGPGGDTASYAASPAAVTVRLWANDGSGGHAGGDRLHANLEHVTGSQFDDRLVGDAGDNTLTGGDGADALLGSIGSDTASYAEAPAAVTADLASGGSAGHADGDSYSKIENLTGSRFDDTLTGDAGANVLTGLAGGDSLTGGGGTDTASYADAPAAVTARLWATGTAGHADGDSYDDVENLAGSDHDDRLVGDAGDNVLTGHAGADELLGSSGTDTASYADAPGGVTVKLWTGSGSRGEADGDRLSGIENLTGSAHADRLVGDAGANTFRPGAGDDSLGGGGNFDTFVFTPGTGRDTVSNWVDDTYTADLQAFGFTDVADVESNATETNGNLVIDLGGGDQLTLKGITKSGFDGADVSV